MVEATFVLNLVETVGILVGVAIAIMEIRKGREERGNQFSLEFVRYTSSQEFWEHWISFLSNSDFSTYEEWSEKYGPYSNPEAAKHWYTITWYYNTLGLRLLNGHIDLEDVVGYVEPYGLLLVWERSFPIFEKWKERYNNPKAFEGFEFLVNEIKKTYPNITHISNPQRQRLMQ